MKRVSATTLESFRRFIASVSESDTEEKAIEAIKGTFKGNDYTKFGNAFHGLLEGKTVKQGKKYYSEGVLFHPFQAKVASDFRQQHPYMIQEMQLSHIYETRAGSIMISGRIDGIEGLQVHDHKCKFGYLDYLEYMDSVQWKIYLSALGIDVFHYNIFEVTGFDGFVGLEPYLLPEDLVIIPHEPLTCTRYDCMEDEIVSLLNDFQEFIIDRGLSEYLKPAKDFAHF